MKTSYFTQLKDSRHHHQQTRKRREIVNKMKTYHQERTNKMMEIKMMLNGQIEIKRKLTKCEFVQLK